MIYTLGILIISAYTHITL